MENNNAKNVKPRARILLVDSHPLIRLGLVTLIEREPDLAVCGEGEDMGQALTLLRRTAPDLIVTALSLSCGHGLEVIRHLRAHDARVPILVCSMHSDALYAQRAVKVGARGYVGKWETPERALAAMRDVLAGRTWISPALSAPATQHVCAEDHDGAWDCIGDLSNQELIVFELIGRGLEISQIAEHLHLSIKTSETHRQNIRHKLGLHTSLELTRMALEWTLEESNYRWQDAGHGHPGAADHSPANRLDRVGSYRPASPSGATMTLRSGTTGPIFT